MTDYKKYWNYPGSPWRTESAWMSWIRGTIRRCWSKHPLKIDILKLRRLQIENPNPVSAKRFPTVWGAKCECCGGVFKLSGGRKESKDQVTIQVDHINPAGAFKDIKDFQGFFERMMLVSPSDLRLVCSDCNKTLALSDKLGVSFEYAKFEREAIAICKTKKDKEWLTERGVVPQTSQPKRRIQIVEWLRSN